MPAVPSMNYNRAELKYQKYQTSTIGKLKARMIRYF